MIYLASPYSHPDPAIQQLRHDQALAVMAGMLRQGEVVYSPIVACRPVALAYDLPHDFTFWQRMNYGILRHANIFTILMLEGWEKSKGLRAEWEMAEELGITVRMTEGNLWLR